MERLELKVRQFEKALGTLQAVLQAAPSEIARDAAIQRFEYTFELCWKTLSLYLREMHGIDCRSPKSCFREGLAVGLYNAATAEKLLRMTDRRNETVHTYNEELANKIYGEIRNVYRGLMDQLLHSLKAK